MQHQISMLPVMKTLTNVKAAKIHAIVNASIYQEVLNVELALLVTQATDLIAMILMSV